MRSRAPGEDSLNPGMFCLWGPDLFSGWFAAAQHTQGDRHCSEHQYIFNKSYFSKKLKLLLNFILSSDIKT